jgi:hypothetical protein
LESRFGDLPPVRKGFINHQFAYRQPVCLPRFSAIGISQTQCAFDVRERPIAVGVTDATNIFNGNMPGLSGSDADPHVPISS